MIPFNNKEILYGEAYEIDKSKIQKAKVGFSGLKIKTVDGKKRKFSINSGKDNLKKILEKLELSAK